MSTDPIPPAPVTLQTNLRKLDPTRDFKLQDVLYCQIRADRDQDHEDNHRPGAPAPTKVSRVVHQATNDYLEVSGYITSPINKSSFFAKPDHQETLKGDASKRFILPTKHDVHQPAEVVGFDYASAIAAHGSIPDIATKTAPSVSNACRISKLRTKVYGPGLVLKCQTLGTNSLISSLAKGAEFVDKSTDIQIPLASLNELVRVIKSPTVLPTNPRSVQDSDGFTLLPGTSPILYRDAENKLLVAEKSHVYVRPDIKLHTLADLLEKQIANAWSKVERTAKLKSLSAMLKGVQVDVQGKKLHETHVVAAGQSIQNLNVPDKFREFFDCIKNLSHDLTVFRSGYLVDGSAGQDVAHLNNEKRLIAKAYRGSHHGRFAYATLSEDKLLKIRADGQELAPENNKHSALLVANVGARRDKDQSRFWVFQSKAAVDGSTGIKVTYCHAAHSSVSSPQHELDSPSPASGSRDHLKPQLPQQPVNVSKDGGPGYTPSRSNNPVVKTTLPPEVSFFGRIWEDENLELYDTKWPIPTYLARLALDRALIHLVTHAWEETDPVFLPDVHKTIGRTLYYI